MRYTELTVWTRGIIMDKEGRDIVNSISASARLEGKYAQAMENYVDNPDRTNAPTRKYCRVSDTVLENELTYENEHPNIVVLVEGTMVKGWDYMRGMPPGGTLVINTHYSPEYMIRFVPGAERLSQLVCIFTMPVVLTIAAMSGAAMSGAINLLRSAAPSVDSRSRPSSPRR